MTVAIFDIPEAREQLVPWLESQLTGLNLVQLVAELEVIHRPSAHGSLADTLGEKKLSLLQSGLTVLSDAQIQDLLTHPRLLLDLQEEILVSGGPHWEVSIRRNKAVQQITNNWCSSLPPVITNRTSLPAIITSCCLTAAAVVGAVFVTRPFERIQQVNVEVPVITVEPADAAWGWLRDDQVESQLPERQYLDQLATAAQEWFDQRSNNPLELAKRLGEFRQGCSRLQLNDHPNLSENTKNWLLANCRIWSRKLNRHLQDLEQQAQPFDDVRTSSDQTVKEIIQILDRGPKPREGAA